MKESEKIELFKAKLHLYGLLLKIPSDEITNEDAELGFLICKQECIQKIFKKDKV